MGAVTPAVVVAGNLTALGVVRSLAHAGIPVISPPCDLVPVTVIFSA